jgi:hypothetical protein
METRAAAAATGLAVARPPLVLLLLPCPALVRVAAALDAASLRRLRATCAALRLVSERLARAAFGGYAAAPAEELLLLLREGQVLPVQPVRLPALAFGARPPPLNSPLELDALLQLAVLDGKLAALAAGASVGSLVSSALAEKLLPNEFAGPGGHLARWSRLQVAKMVPDEALAARALGCSRPLYFGPHKLATHSAALRERLQRDEEEQPRKRRPIAGSDSATADTIANVDAENRTMESDHGGGSGSGSPFSSNDDDDDDDDSYVVCAAEREAIDLIIGRNTSPAFYHLKQDFLNGIVNALQNQFAFCSQVLRFPPLQPITEMPDPTAFACHVSRAAGCRVATPERVRALYTAGFFLVDDFVPAAEVAAVYSRCREFVRLTDALAARKLSPEELELELGEERPEFLMSRGDPPSARGDCLQFLSRDRRPGSAAPFSLVLDRLTVLGEELGAVVRLQGGKESQLAHYPGAGTGYRRHRDAIPDDGSRVTNNRRITAIAYCTPDWRNAEQHGGALRLFCCHLPNQPVCDVAPRPGRLLVFLSGVVDHAVMPSVIPRVAITTWFW